MNAGIARSILLTLLGLSRAFPGIRNPTFMVVSPSRIRHRGTQIIRMDTDGKKQDARIAKDGQDVFSEVR